MKTTIKNNLLQLITATKAVFARPAPDTVELPMATIFTTYERAVALRAEQAATLLKTKQTVARHRLGTKHIHHPHYRFDPRHSNDTAIYPHFREHYINEVRDAAEVARSDNPAHLRHIATLYHLTGAK